MKIYLIRHGETDWNIAGRLQGREDIPLNERGMRQALDLGRTLSSVKEQIKISSIFSSPLSRAYDTASVIAQSLGIEYVEVNDGFTERDFGSLSGKAPTAGHSIFSPDETASGLEPLEEVSRRFIAAIEHCSTSGLRNTSNTGNILIVSHGGAINAVLSKVSNGEAGTGKTRLKNCSINILLRNGPYNFSLDVFNLSPEQFLAGEKPLTSSQLHSITDYFHS